MHRREYLIRGLGAVSIISIAGCAADSDNPSEGTNETTDSAGLVALDGHDIGVGRGGYYNMNISVENTSDRELNRVDITVSAFDEKTRLDDVGVSISDLPPGITDSETALLTDFTPDEVTRYTISITVLSEDYAELPPIEREFSGDDFRERLNS